MHQAASLYSDKIAVCFDECNNQPPVYYTHKTVVNAASELSNFLLLKSESVSRSVVSNSLRPMDCSPLGSSVYGILQARILECVAISSSKESSLPRDWTHISCIGRQIQSGIFPPKSWDPLRRDILVSKNSGIEVKSNSDVGHAPQPQFPYWQVILKGFLGELKELMSGNPLTCIQESICKKRCLMLSFTWK